MLDVLNEVCSNLSQINVYMEMMIFQIYWHSDSFLRRDCETDFAIDLDNGLVEVGC